MLDLEFAQASDCGPVRDHNEDFVGCAVPEAPRRDQSRGWLFALADGLGGQEKGDVAARVAVETLLKEFQRTSQGAPLRSLLPRLVQNANHQVVDAGMQSKPRGAAMATTLVACALRSDRAVISHVGDSRCYLIRDGRAAVLTRDHTLATQRTLLGLISNRKPGPSNVLTRSLGNDLFVRVDTSEHLLLDGDVLLLCSDGLHRAVPAAQMTETVTFSRSLDAAARALIDAAIQRDGGDNVSVQLIRINRVERAGARLYKTA